MGDYGASPISYDGAGYVHKTTITARDLPDAWFQALWAVLDFGREFTIDRGSYAGSKRLEFDWVTVHIKYPGTRPLLPDIPAHFGIPNPVKEDYLDGYLPYLMTDEKKEGEDYTYGQRIHWQIPQICETYKEHGYRNNQLVLQVAQPDDLNLVDPPCLRHIDTRIQDGKLHFFVYFRSWDLWGGFPANLGAIQLLKEYMAAEIGVEDGEIVASSKGLHLYDYAVDLAKLRCMRGY